MTIDCSRQNAFSVITLGFSRQKSILNLKILSQERESAGSYTRVFFFAGFIAVLNLTLVTLIVALLLQMLELISIDWYISFLLVISLVCLLTNENQTKMSMKMI